MMSDGHKASSSSSSGGRKFGLATTELNGGVCVCCVMCGLLTDAVGPLRAGGEASPALTVAVGPLAIRKCVSNEVEEHGSDAGIYEGFKEDHDHVLGPDRTRSVQGKPKLLRVQGDTLSRGGQVHIHTQHTHTHTHACSQSTTKRFGFPLCTLTCTHHMHLSPCPTMMNTL